MACMQDKPNPYESPSATLANNAWRWQLFRRASIFLLIALAVFALAFLGLMAWALYDFGNSVRRSRESACKDVVRAARPHWPSNQLWL
jgi:hypothetical protein